MRLHRSSFRIVMLVASNPIERSKATAIVASHPTGRPSSISAKPACAFRPTKPDRHRSRQAGGSASKSLSIRLAVPKPDRCFSAMPLSFAGAPMPPLRKPSKILPKRHFRYVLSEPPRSGRQPRATHCICGSPGRIPKNLRGAFSDAAAGIVAASVEKTYHIFNRLGLKIERGIPFRHGKAAPRKRVAQAKFAWVIHRPSHLRWTTSFHPVNQRDSALGCYPPRCASSRNRRALSLMKPAASF